MIKKAISFFLALGGLQLILYFRSNDLPIPVDILTTSSIVLFFGVMLMLIAAMLILLNAIAVLITINIQDSPVYQKLFYEEAESTSNIKPHLKRMGTYCVLFLPLLLWLTSIIYDIDGYLLLNNIGLIEILWVFVFTAYTFTNNSKIIQYFTHFDFRKKMGIWVKFYFSVICAKIAWLISISLGLLFLKNAVPDISDNNSAVFLIFLSAINYILLTPRKSKNNFQRNSEKYVGKTSFLGALQSVHEPSLIVIFTGILSAIWIWPNSLMTTATLKFMGIGGIDRQYHFSYKDKDTIPKEVVFLCEKGAACTTQKMHIVFDIGSLIIAEVKPKMFFYLPREKMKPIIDANPIKVTNAKGQNKNQVKSHQKP